MINNIHLEKVPLGNCENREEAGLTAYQVIFTFDLADDSDHANKMWETFNSDPTPLDQISLDSISYKGGKSQMKF